jgi:hypothetical protein
MWEGAFCKTPPFLDFALSAVAFVPQDGYLSLFMGLVSMP